MSLSVASAWVILNPQAPQGRQGAKKMMNNTTTKYGSIQALALAIAMGAASVGCGGQMAGGPLTESAPDRTAHELAGPATDEYTASDEYRPSPVRGGGPLPVETAKTRARAASTPGTASENVGGATDEYTASDEYRPTPVKGGR